MASRGQILPALGDLEWEAFGGKIHSQKHPSGRVSYIYVAPDGKKFRSWKMCLVHMGEQESGPIGQKARERQKSLTKNPRPFRKNRQRKKTSLSPKLSAHSDGQQATDEAGEEVAPVIGLPSQRSPPPPEDNLTPEMKWKSLFPDTVTPPASGEGQGQQATWAGEGMSLVVSIPSQNSPPQGNGFPEVKSKDSFPDARTPPSSRGVVFA